MLSVLLDATILERLSTKYVSPAATQGHFLIYLIDQISDGFLLASEWMLQEFNLFLLASDLILLRSYRLLKDIKLILGLLILDQLASFEAFELIKY